jgi:glutamate/tyrosine decarboxylase-like PLP-dependent enzyme
MAANPAFAIDADLAEAATRASTYLRNIVQRRVAPSEEDIARLLEIQTDFPETGVSTSEILRILDEFGAPASIANAGGRYFGFVNGGTLRSALAASWLVSAWDQNAGLTITSPCASFFEEVAIHWVVQALGLPKSSGGAVVTGATAANFVCLCAARHELLKRAGWDAEGDGLFGAPPIQVVVGGEVHASMLKALSLSGFGKKRVHRVPADAQGRMRADALPDLNANTLVCIQAGNVNTGAFDPADEICARARDSGAWIHVDGAFGLWATLSPRFAHLVRGFELADSWAVDAHKWPNVGYDCGIGIVRSEDALRAAMTFSAPYLPPASQRDPAHYGPEISRRARGVELWAALRALGRNGLAELIEQTCRHARRFAEGLRAAGFEVLNDVVINQVLVSFGGPARTRTVIAEIQREGTCWCGGTEWQGRTAMRISVSSWMTTDDDVERSLASICSIAARVRLEREWKNDQ